MVSTGKDCTQQEMIHTLHIITRALYKLDGKHSIWRENKKQTNCSLSDLCIGGQRWAALLGRTASGIKTQKRTLPELTAERGGLCVR